MTLDEAEKRIVKLEEALKIIREWKLPVIGTCPNTGRPINIALEFGMDGIRDHFRHIAEKALES